MDFNAFRKMSYGLFLLTTEYDGKENGCIINTAIQCASEPRMISICVIKKNLSKNILFIQYAKEYNYIHITSFEYETSKPSKL